MKQNAHSTFDETLQVVFNPNHVVTDNKDSIVLSNRSCMLLASGYFRLHDVNGTNISTIVSKYIDNGKFEFRTIADHYYRMILFPQRQLICIHFTKLDNNRCKAIQSDWGASLDSYFCQFGVIGLKKSVNNPTSDIDSENVSKFLDIFKNKLDIGPKTHVGFDEIIGLKVLNDNGFDKANMKTYYLDCVRIDNPDEDHSRYVCNFGIDDNFEFFELYRHERKTTLNDKFEFDQGDSVMIDLKYQQGYILSFYKISNNNIDKENIAINNYNVNNRLLIGDDLSEDCFEKGKIKLDDQFDYILGFGTAGCDCNDMGGNLHTIFV